MDASHVDGVLDFFDVCVRSMVGLKGLLRSPHRAVWAHLDRPVEAALGFILQFKV